jgi:hypothetical protein
LVKTTFNLKTKQATLDIEQYNKEIDDTVSRVENGEFYTPEEVMKMSKD